MPHYAHQFPTPLGDALAVADADGALTRLTLRAAHTDPASALRLPPGETPHWDAAPFDALVAQLGEYFAGTRRAFDLPLAPRGTSFQRAVWDELTRIPHGDIVTYGQLAARLGSPGASRAVGLANGANPLWIVVPCHRVVGASGTLTGYAGGLDIKRALLTLERGFGGLFED